MDRYRSRTDLDLTALPWYQALALWKAAIFCEAIHTRWLRGERLEDRAFGPSLEAGVPRLLDMAAQYAGLTAAARTDCGTAPAHLVRQETALPTTLSTTPARKQRRSLS